jgi:hypothetical protein
MLAAKIDAEEGRMPSSGAAAAGTAPVAAAPEDRVATLARLAELRGSGEVTAEEFDLKNAEILARI